MPGIEERNYQKFKKEEIHKTEKEQFRVNGLIEGLQIAETLVRRTCREPGILGTTDISEHGKQLLKMLGAIGNEYNQVSLKYTDVLKRANEQ